MGPDSAWSGLNFSELLSSISCPISCEQETSLRQELDAAVASAQAQDAKHDQEVSLTSSFHNFCQVQRTQAELNVVLCGYVDVRTAEPAG